MKTFRPQGYAERKLTLEGWPAHLVSYQIEDQYLCEVDNVSPGALLARVIADTREEAEEEAIERASGKLQLTRRFTVG
jgi:hypothetical protein